MTNVVHCKKEKYDVMIDRTTVFGNPFLINEYCTREQSVKFFAYYFYHKMYHDKYFCFKVEKELKGKTLGCWCSPLACHGDIIVAYLEGDADAKW